MKQTHARWACLLIFSFTASAFPAETLRFEFKDLDAPDSPFKYQGKHAEKYGKVDGKGLLMTLPAERTTNESLGLGGKFTLSGDFQVTLRYEILHFQDPPPPYGTGAALWMRFDGEPRLGAVVTRTRRPEGDRFVANRITTNEKGGDKYNPTFFPAKSNFGRLRVARIGKTIQYEVEDGDSNEFTRLYQWEATDADVLNLFPQATSSAQIGAVTVRFIDIEVRADSIERSGERGPIRKTVRKDIPPQQPTEADFARMDKENEQAASRKWNLLLVGAIGIGVFVLGLLLFLRGRNKEST